VIAGVFIAVACAVLGVFIILRRESMIGHGLAHAAFAGVAIGILLDIFPIATALILAVATSILILKLKDKAGLYGDTGIAIFSSAGFAIGIILVSVAKGFNVDLFSYLFGDILAIETREVWFSIGLAASVVILVNLNYSKLLYMTFDWEAARASGIKVKKLDMMIAVLTAVTVVMGMRVVGIILVSALIVIPAASGLLFAKNFKRALQIAVLNAVISVVLGLALSFHLNIPASGALVLVSFLIFGILIVVKNKKLS